MKKIVKAIDAKSMNVVINCGHSGQVDYCIDQIKTYLDSLKYSFTFSTSDNRFTVGKTNIYVLVYYQIVGRGYDVTIDFSALVFGTEQSKFKYEKSKLRTISQTLSSCYSELKELQAKAKPHLDHMCKLEEAGKGNCNAIDEYLGNIETAMEQVSDAIDTLVSY